MTAQEAANVAAARRLNSVREAINTASGRGKNKAIVHNEVFDEAVKVWLTSNGYKFKPVVYSSYYEVTW